MIPRARSSRALPTTRDSSMDLSPRGDCSGPTRGHGDASHPLRSPRKAAAARATRKKKQASGVRASKQSQHAPVVAVLAGAAGLGVPLEVGLDNVALAAARAMVLTSGAEAFAHEGAARGDWGGEGSAEICAARRTRDTSLRNFLGSGWRPNFFFLSLIKVLG
ncbi:hypothetical protein SEVIR_4G261501v4 [Setaria viridis]